MKGKKLKNIILVIIASFLLPVSGFAWGKTGHRIIGEIAEAYLTPKAKAAIHEILGNETIAIAGNWADFVRSDSSYNYLSPWHYINLPDSLSYPDLKTYLQNDEGPDVYTQINEAIKGLKNPETNKEDKNYYLHILIHLVGDIHQPMHVSRAEDRGGNSIKLYWFRETTNLHAVWDEKLIKFQELSYTEYAQSINFASAYEIKDWQKTPIEEWVFESHQIALSLYDELSGMQNPHLGFEYDYKHLNLLNKQLLKAGIRLAGLLNEIFI
jgi:hypothetical protein